jgi:GR25 family glycosyltransferase involved in LPS biosynthesis
MSYVNTIIDQVFIINMDKDTERLQKITEKLRLQNISFERIPGIHGRDIDYSEHLTPLCNKTCPNSVKGCALSHRKIWEIAHERGYNNIIILEDDSDIPENLSMKLQKIWDKRPPNYDIITMGAMFFGREKDNPSEYIQSLTNVKPIEYNDSFIELKGLTSTHALIVSRAGIEKLLSMKIDTHVDLNITLWKSSHPIDIYAVDTFDLQQNDDNNSNQSDSSGYPRMSNYLLSKFQISNYRNVTYVLNISVSKFGYLTTTPFMQIIFFLALILPSKYQMILLGYLFVEFLVYPSVKQAAPFFISWFSGWYLSKYLWQFYNFARSF